MSPGPGMMVPDSRFPDSRPNYPLGQACLRKVGSAPLFHARHSPERHHSPRPHHDGQGSRSRRLRPPRTGLPGRLPPQDQGRPQRPRHHPAALLPVLRPGQERRAPEGGHASRRTVQDARAVLRAVRDTDRAQELQPRVHRPVGEGGPARDPAARHPAHLRVAARRPGRAPAHRDADPPAQQDRRDDGGLHPRPLRGDPSGAAEARQAPGRDGPEAAAVLRCCTAPKSPRRISPAGALSCVDLRGFEPLTPSMRTRCATSLRHRPLQRVKL